MFHRSGPRHWSTREVATLLAVSDGPLREVATYESPQVGGHSVLDKCSPYFSPGQEVERVDDIDRYRQYYLPQPPRIARASLLGALPQALIAVPGIHIVG